MHQKFTVGYIFMTMSYDIDGNKIKWKKQNMITFFVHYTFLLRNGQFVIKFVHFKWNEYYSTYSRLLHFIPNLQIINVSFDKEL